MDKLLLRVEEAAEALGLGRAKTYELLMSGALESVTIGRRRLVSSEALRAYVRRLAGDAEPYQVPVVEA